MLETSGPDFKYVSAGDIPMPGYTKPPRPLTIPEIKEYIDLFAVAARNAVFGAGFDAVEVHCANGYLIDQFLQTTSNNRTDAYGGSIENRMRFGLEVIDAVVKEVGQKRTGMRLSPWATFWGKQSSLSDTLKGETDKA
jgi:NADPH2 dehydrogenase